MKLSLFVVLLGSLGGVAFAACADDDASPPVTDTPDAHDIVAPDASDAAAPADAGCDECAAPVDCKEADFCAATAPFSTSASLNAVWGSSATDVWVVGTRATILHGDGTTFTSVSVADADAGVGDETIFFSLWGAAKDDVWVGPARAPLHYAAITDGGAPTWQVAEGTTWDEGSADQGRTAAIWGSSAASVWIAGPQSPRFGGFGSFWASGKGARNALTWTEQDAYQGDIVTSASIRALWGADANDVFAVGDLGQAFRFVPAAGRTLARWSAIDTLTAASLDAVWGTSASDVWAVGAEGTLRHFTGDAFAVATSPTTQSLHGIWGTSASDVWAVGDRATILHFDGTAWTVEPNGLPVGESPALFAIWGSGPDDIWIGGEGVLLHRTAMNRRLP